MAKSSDRSDGSFFLIILFLAYLVFLVRFVVIKCPFKEALDVLGMWNKELIRDGLDQANFTLLKTIKMYLEYAYKLNSFDNLAGNIVLLIPFGVLLPGINRIAGNFFGFLIHAGLLVLMIEIFQMATGLGVFDVDDILLNMVGCVFGFCVYTLLPHRRKKRRNR